jgi:hypothetical protein
MMTTLELRSLAYRVSLTSWNPYGVDRICPIEIVAGWGNFACASREEDDVRSFAYHVCAASWKSRLA